MACLTSALRSASLFTLTSAVQVLDPALVQRALLGEPVSDPHLAIQRAASTPGNTSGCNPAGSNSGRRAKASIPLVLVCRPLVLTDEEGRPIALYG